MRQTPYCRYHSTPLYDQMIAVRRHSGIPGSRCFQMENTGSKLEENIGISQITELSVVDWGYYHVYFLFLLAHLAADCKQEEICSEFSKHFFTC